MAHVAQSRNVIRHVVYRGTAFHKSENAIHHPLLFACQGVRYRKLEVILTTVGDSRMHFSFPEFSINKKSISILISLDLN